MMEQKRLGDIATYINGFAFKPEDRSTVGLPIIRIQDLTGNAYDLGFYDGSYPKRIEINDGDVLISWSASLGVYVWNRGKALLNQHIFKVAFDKCDVNREFFVYAVRHKLKEMESKTHGATMKHIVKKDFDNTLIPFPTLNEQGKIAKLLDTAATIISARQQQLQKLDDLVKARFVEMFGDPISNPKGWKKDKAESHIDLLSGYPFQSEQYVNDGINICGGLIIMPQKILWQDCRHWPSVDGYEDYLLAEDDIVMALDRPWISEGFKIAQVDSTHLPALLIQRTARIRGIDVNQQFLFHCFVNGGFDKHSNVTGSLVPHISAKDIRSFEILLPPIKLQKQFAAFVKQVDKSKVAIQKALDEAQLLFDSLMQKYFE